eukprot:4593466-Pyramimonas_sp.AAC.1
MDRGLDSNACDAAPGPEEGDVGDADGVDLVDVDAPPGMDPDDAEVEVSEPLAERFKKAAASLPHLLIHTPKNPSCSVCNWAKAVRKQQRKAQNKELKVSRPYANPT